jgi:hypothetical protein
MMTLRLKIETGNAVGDPKVPAVAVSEEVYPSTQRGRFLIAVSFCSYVIDFGQDVARSDAKNDMSRNSLARLALAPDCLQVVGILIGTTGIID